MEEVTEILCVTLPDLWKLGQTYLSGKLFVGVALLTENQQKLARRCDSSRGRFEVRSPGCHVTLVCVATVYHVTCIVFHVIGLVTVSCDWCDLSCD